MKKISILIIFILSTLTLSATNLRIEPNELSKDITSYKILDVRDSEAFQEGHIKNALNFPISLTYEHKSVNGKITQPAKMQSILRDLGLNVHDKVVVYDDGTFFDAARLFWTLEVYGFTNVKLLNAGFQEWEVDNLPVSTTTLTPIKSDYIATINNKRLATKFITQIATKSPTQVIIDARGINAYVGKVSSAKRYGHIPKAINIPATHNINGSNTLLKLKTTKELQETYKGIAKDKKIVLYCAVGRISATNYFAMRELGYDVANYDASWKEWGNDFNLPIVNLTNSK